VDHVRYGDTFGGSLPHSGGVQMNHPVIGAGPALKSLYKDTDRVDRLAIYSRTASAFAILRAPAVPVKAAVQNSLGNMLHLNALRIIQIGNGAGHFEDPVVSPG